MSKIINFEEGWGFIQQGIKKLKNNLEGFEGFHETPQFTADDYSLLYTYVRFPETIYASFCLFSF